MKKQIVIKIIKKKYTSRKLSRAIQYFSEVQNEELDYFIEYYLNSALLPVNNKIIKCIKNDNRLILYMNKSTNLLDYINTLKKTKFFNNIINMLYYNKLIICYNIIYE